MALFGRYEYVGELGRGTTGRVLLALDRAADDAPRALKVVAPEHAARLVWEFTRLSRVEHPRVARVRELLRVEQAVAAPFSLPPGALLLVEDRAPGRPVTRLSDRADDSEQRLRLGLSFALGAASGLAALHDVGLVHGDVKPDNVLWDDEHGATVVDLGFARAPTVRAQVRGTPRYMAPELLAGLCTAPADVFALGALLFDWLSGEVSDHPSSNPSAELGDLHLSRDASGLSTVYPVEVRRLVAHFLQRDPELRPADGRAALHALLGVHHALGLAVDPESVRFASAADSGTPGERAQRARTSPFVGQREALSQLVSALDAALKQGTPAPPIRVIGARGAGSSRFVREGVRRLQEQRAREGRGVPTTVDRISSLAGLREVDAVLWLERPDPDSLRQALRARDGFASAGRSLALIVEGELPAGVDEAGRWPYVELGALASSDFDQLLARLVASERIERIREAAREASAGLGGRLCECVVDAVLNGKELADPASFRAAPLVLDTRGLTERGRDLACWLAWTEGAVHDRELATRALGGARALEHALDELTARGALNEADGELALVPELARALRKQGIAAWQARFDRTVRAGTLGDAPFLVSALGERERAAPLFARLAEKQIARGHFDEARALLREALSFAESDALRLKLAELLRQRAHYAVARHVLRDVAGDAAAWTRAELSRLSGDAAAASRELLQVQRSPWLSRASALRARLAFDAGDFAGARRELVACADAGDGMARQRALEVEALLALSEGRPGDARVGDLVMGAEKLAQARPLARALALRAQVEVAAGRRARAQEDLRRAQREAEAAGELHESATYAMNLGLLELEAGSLGSALESLRTAAYSLTLIDRSADLVRVLYNLGSAAVLVGDDERAEWVLKDAEARAHKGTDRAVQAMIAVVQSELRLRQGAVEEAHALLRAALARVPDELADSKATLSARTGLVALLRGNLEEAGSLLALGRSLGRERAAQLELSTLELRLQLSRGEHLSALDAARRIVRELGEGTAFSLHVTVLLAASDAARAAGQEDLALEWSGLCRALLERALVGLSPALRARMRRVPAFARVLSGQSAAGPTGENGASRWRSLVRGSRRLFAERRPTRIAQRMTELALDLVHAERALVVVESEGGELRVMARAELAGEHAREAAFSRSVVRRVWLENRPVISLEAAHDERFDGAQSVHALSVRSVLAVPVLGLAERAVLYLDDRLRGSAFGADEQALLNDLSELTRQALATGQAVVKEQRRALQSAQQEKRLARQLATLASQPTTTSDAPFVGTSPGMLRLTERARRVALADVPVLISGQSGTGKELLARFVHAASARKAAPFVAESCAALPDTLLESALFGHVRGAFTGADRARRGLFELADGGSLLLDEVAEMSPALQGKLLRVLQEGEFRALGSEKVRKVDVRVMAASHRDLAQRVREGAFREDLYYRLAVVTLELPSLAERREDIPLLVRHFVEKYRGERELRVTAEAMRLFEARSYPGNIRQLENEVRRALALCDGVIRAEHVEEPAVPVLERAPDAKLDLHAQTEALTRELVEVAMQRTGGNVSQAALLLGISRFGLQKILKRLRVDQRK